MGVGGGGVDSYRQGVRERGGGGGEQQRDRHRRAREGWGWGVERCIHKDMPQKTGLVTANRRVGKGMCQT